MIQLAGAADPAAHQFHQALADRQSEAGPAVPARGGRIGLGEAGENHLDLVGRHADAGVGDAKAERTVGISRHAHSDAAAFSKFKRVADQIQKHLPQSAGVAAEPRRHLRLYLASERKPLDFSVPAHQFHGAIEDRAQIEILALQFDAAGFRFRKVKNIVDQFQKIVPGALKHPHVFALLRAERRIREQAGHAEDGIHGSADLMTHDGQKLAFGAAGGLGRQFRAKQFRLGLLAFEDLAELASDVRHNGKERSFRLDRIER